VRNQSLCTKVVHTKKLMFVCICVIQMQQGRRTASLKASYEAVSKSVELTKELALGREYAAATSRSAQASSASDNVAVIKASSSRNKKCVLCDVSCDFIKV